ncbi:MAG: 50S ribosomal protein L18 [Cyanobacteria bacterium HKST-UBA04]|nr:50S ribosomal protein L18 [Cyanobacteria bacterium HKST-UBA04]MCA9841711.1 50S ribosomal protein L18 [Cyanobacteria bacterium HKST-UBA03]
MANKMTRKDATRKRHRRVRGKLSGTTERPRLAVYRSLKHISAQVIDDVTHKTLASASSTEKGMSLKHGGNIDAAQAIGKAIGERAKKAGVATVVFDRGGNLYHGRIKALADAARETGLTF